MTPPSPPPTTQEENVPYKCSFKERYCLFGLNVALTEKLESNSEPMKIHISQPCKDLLPTQYKTEERTGDPDLRNKVGGYASHFLLSKDGRKPLSCDVLKALLPTASEAPRLYGGERETDINEEEEVKDNGATGQERKNGEVSNGGVSNGKWPSNRDPRDDDDDDSGSLYEPEVEKARMRRASEADLEFCGGFEYKSTMCNIM